MAKQEGYTALANGDTVYLYDDANGGIWQEYAHSDDVAEMHFDGAGNLYLLDQQAKLYKLSVPSYEEGVVAEETGITCNAFCVDEGTLYHSRQSWIYKAPLSDLSLEEPLYNTPSITTSAIDVWEGEVYYLYGLNYLYKLSLTTLRSTEAAKIPEKTTAFTLTNGNFFGVTSDDYFYGYPLTELSNPSRTPLVEGRGGYSALAAYDSKLYVLENTAVKKYAQGELLPADGEFLRPALSAIPVGNIKTEVDEGNFEVVATNAASLLVEVDLNAEGSFLPCLSATRKERLTALKIAETEYYALLSYRGKTENGYTAYLVDKRNVTPLGEEYTPVYDEPKTGYLTNAVGLYKFPHLELPTTTTLPRGAEISLVGEVKGLSRAYYKVRYGEEEGYIPAEYIVEQAYPSLETERVELGNTTDNDGVWRLVYILLGGAAICILVDFLILRKKPDDE